MTRYDCARCCRDLRQVAHKIDSRGRLFCLGCPAIVDDSPPSPIGITQVGTTWTMRCDCRTVIAGFPSRGAAEMWAAGHSCPHRPVVTGVRNIGPDLGDF